jgi:trans-aconitate 2-methyltransferase
MTTPRDWDGATYDQVADPMTRWGRTVIERLPLDGNETVLDAGCGSGRVTELLARALPNGRVIALDGSASMLEEARARLAPFEPRIEYVLADLRAPLRLTDLVDAILSTATFHWLPDHGALFRNLAAVLRPGGRLAAQCGGAGNIASVVAILASIGDGWVGPWTFATPAETRARLEAAGFTEIEAWLTAEPTPIEPGPRMETYLRTVILGDHLARLAQAEREPFVRAVAARMTRPEIDYVRLNINARRAG